MRRLEKLKKRLVEKDFLTKHAWWGAGETVLTSEEVKALPLIVRKALAIRLVAQKMPVEIHEDELIVGMLLMASVSFGSTFPEYALPEEIHEASLHGLSPQTVFGHHPIRYEKLLAKGVCGVRADIMAQLEKRDVQSTDQETYDLYTAMLISLDALTQLAQRYSAALIEAAAAQSDLQRRRELLDMARVCSRVPEHPPESFHEALQSVWMTFALCHSTMEMIPIGRTDQYLYPFYKKDLDEGRLTKEQAEDLMGSFLVKFSERIQLTPELWEQHNGDWGSYFNGLAPGTQTDGCQPEDDISTYYGTSANAWLINMILGGVTADGKDATNDLTYMILDEWAYLETVVPVMSVRLNSHTTPEKLYRRCAEILRTGSGEPILYNDDVIIPGYQKLGLSPEEARGYSNDGCWETLIPGRTNFGFCLVHLLQLMEYMLQGGRSLVRNCVEWEHVPPLEQLDSFETFYSVLFDMVRQQSRIEIETRLTNLPIRAHIAPSPLLSAFMEDSVENGKEYSLGGARYNIFGMMLCGLSNCVDALAAIKKLVYEDHTITLAQLSEALRSNFEGYEDLRSWLMSKAPKFGNDDRYVDDIAARLMNDYAAAVDAFKEEYQGRLLPMPGVATYEFYAKWGLLVGASADGRLSQKPIASNYSPVHGMDVLGPTAAMCSTAAPKLGAYILGAPLDMEINPNDLPGEPGIDRLVALIKGYMDMDGVILSITGVTREKLLAAQKEPEKYKSLRVRLGGLSAFFISLTPEMQQTIIDRTSHGQ